MKKVLILASGGIDSLTIIANAINNNCLPVVLSFDYNQKNLVELDCLKKSLEQFEKIVFLKFNTKIQHIILNLNFDLFKSNLLSNNHLNNNLNTDNNFNTVEKYNSIQDLPTNIKPSTYVPARNTIFASYALAIAESFGIDEIFLGIHKEDAPNYPDCSYAYFKALQNLFLIASENKVTVNAPLINLSKSEIIKLGLSLELNYFNTLSCYDPIEAVSCKKCHACIIRQEAFAKNNIVE